MIRCRLAHLEFRCRQRGYTLEQVRPCIVSEDGDTITVDETHPAYPRAKPGLGDMVKAGLSAVGITEERVSKAIGRPCGCSKRAEQLNAIGRKFGMS
jgi:hypothetical protein